VGRIGTIARWKPVHLGHLAALDAVLARGDEAVVGLGSTNRYDARNPWSPEETEAMLRAAIGARGHCRLLRVPDLGDGPRWKEMVADLFGPLDLFVTANTWVRDLLKDRYPIAHPVWLIPPERRIALNATMVRLEMARGEGWRAQVPPAVAAYLDGSGLVERFRREFGPELLEGGGRSPVD
jgi:nicotinamide-nucleotide adenylyltransferase